MEIKILKEKTAVLKSPEQILQSVDDFVDLLGNANYQGANKIFLNSFNLPEGFFELRNGIAGEILQKFSNYSMKLAIAGNFQEYKSKSLQDFIRESNHQGQILFVSDWEEAITLFGNAL